MLQRFLIFWVVCGCVLISATGEVKELSESGFVIVHSEEVTKDPRFAFNVFVEGIGKWWSSDHTYSGEAKNLSIEARPGGCFCEKLPDGGVEHLRVGYLQSGKSIRLLGGLGPLQEFPVAGSMTVLFKGAETGTTIEVTYRVSGQVDGGFKLWAPNVDFVIGEQFSRLKKYIDTGSPE